jgi:hypothetical protein
METIRVYFEFCFFFALLNFGVFLLFDIFIEESFDRVFFVLLVGATAQHCGIDCLFVLVLFLLVAPVFHLVPVRNRLAFQLVFQFLGFLF